MPLIAVLLAGCGSSGQQGPDRQADSGATAPTGKFPVKIEHAFGMTEIKEEPTRVISLGLSDQDPMLAIGIKPIAISPWYGDYPDGIWPWQREAYGDSKPIVLNGGVRNEAEPPYEEIASLKPDLIVGLYNGTDQQQYERLSQIAPTVVPDKEYLNFEITWQESMRATAEAFGREDDALKVIGRLDGRFAETAAENPPFAGKTAVVAERFDANAAETVVRSGNDVRAKFFQDLGFTIPTELAGAKANSAGEIKVSDEQMSVLSKDLLVWNIGWDNKIKPQIESNRGYQELPVTKAGKVLWIDDPVVSGAFSWGTALSLDYALDEVVPPLRKVVKD